MKIIVDSTTQRTLPLDNVTVLSVDSSRHHTLTDNTQGCNVQIRAEWLYSMYVDKQVDLLVVEDGNVARVLNILGVPVVSLV